QGFPKEGLCVRAEADCLGGCTHVERAWCVEARCLADQQSCDKVASLITAQYGTPKKACRTIE
ncbi:MAG TPA: hypothetical protein VFV99_28630, partial [Kofleriaceae bacterium]|nr:hypothetical protein [Kofleriaceae bacterium]